jgi:hypothetical protein
MAWSVGLIILAIITRRSNVDSLALGYDNGEE